MGGINKILKVKDKIIRRTCRLAGIKIGLICKDNNWGIEYIDSPKGKSRVINDAVHKPFVLLSAGYQTKGSLFEVIHQIRCMGYEPGFSMASVGEPKVIPGEKIEFVYRDKKTGLQVLVTFKSAGKGAVIHAGVTATNHGRTPVTVEHISPLFPGLCTAGQDEWIENMRIHFARNSWFSEAQWHDRLICEEGINAQYLGKYTTTVFQLHSTGSFSSGRYLPMAILEDRADGKCFFWEIHYSGSWFMEVGIQDQRFYALASGPTKIDSHFSKTIKPGESLASVPIAFGVTDGGFNEAIAELTKYRRADMRPACGADKKLPVIFNDYMNCLFADPTEEKEIPIIESAGRAGAEYYIIDDGWYAPREKIWWNTGEGDWCESTDRFPRGLRFLTDKVRENGMVPGLWLEIEVMGIDCPMANSLPDDWFFHRGGKRIISAGRYFLDFANPAVRKHCHSIVSRLMKEYNIGYLKIDYNVNHREGNETRHESAGAGQIANISGLYLWLDEVRRKYPDLIIESCSSGGGRLDYGILAHAHLQSTTDQTDYFRMPSITTGTLTAGLPEQMCQWAYPKQDAGPENVVFCMMVAMLSRFYLSGQIHRLNKRGFELVQEAISVYKGYRQDIPGMVPFFPIGTTLIHRSDGFVVAGLKKEDNSLAYLTVFRLDSKDKTIEIPLAGFNLKSMNISILYPAKMPGKTERRAGGIKVTLPVKRTARLICMRYKVKR